MGNKGENLVIVESPAKAKTIEKILGKDYTVMSSFGHIRDLSKKKLGIDIDHGFMPQYEISADKKKVVSELKSSADKASTVWLASDEDREGEAIAWHLAETLELDSAKTKRIVFHEITDAAIKKAILEPRDINMNLVMAQQARRVLDRLVGFELSPVLWKKIKPALSAGRVQSVALRLVVEREREINKFESTPYYKVEGIFNPAGVHGILNRRFPTKEEAEAFLRKCIDAVFTVGNIEKKEVSRTPAPPFTTSTLQQEAARKCGFSVSRTMSIAQHLYESGLITYMRTDSTTLSQLAIGTAKNWIVENFGESYHKARQYKTKVKGAQEAHEAIRPTYIANTEIQGTADEKRLYSLIWKRTIASQMADAKMEKTEIRIDGDKFLEYFEATGSTILFDGFLKVYMESRDDESDSDEDKILPPMNIGDVLVRKEITASEKYPSHPPRYTEASLVRKMEELGVGRPSTYAPTITTLHNRGYVSRQDKPGTIREVNIIILKGNKIESKLKPEKTGVEKSRLCPEDIGIIVTDFLKEEFPSILDYGFTAKVEEDFDKVAAGEKVWNRTIQEFYAPFHEKVEETIKEVAHLKSRRELGTDPVTGKIVLARMGRFGSVVQIGEDDDPEKKIFGMDKGQLIDSITLEDALKLTTLPKILGENNGEQIIVAKGRFGPYIKYGKSSFASVPRGTDPLSVTLEQALAIISENEERKKNKDIKSFPEKDIAICNGRFGPYIKHDGANYKIPKGRKPEELTVEECLEIIDAAPAKPAYKKPAGTATKSTAKTKTASKTTAKAAAKTASTKSSSTKTKKTAAKPQKKE